MDKSGHAGRNRLRTASRWRSASLFALQGLGTARQRALLALLGIVVGVAAVVALISIGKSVERQALSEFESMGTQVIYISIHQADPMERLVGRKPRAEDADATPQRQRRRQLLQVLKAMPEVELGSELLSASCDTAARAASSQVQPRLMAIQPSMQQILGLKMEQGRFLHPLDQKALWVVLGNQMAQKMRSASIDVRPGATVSLCGQTMSVAGVLAPASTSEATVPVRIDDTLFISVAAVERLSTQDQGETMILRVRPRVSPVEFAARLQHDLEQQNAGDVQIDTSQKVIDLRRRQAVSYTRFLTALSSVSLFVGGLGILNIMLVAVIERRREIGIRLAIGADEVDIALQFLLESALLALVGGLGGILMGFVAALVVAWLAQLPFVFSVSSILLALLVSLVVGVSAGVYPAIQASRQDPVAALQSD